MSELVANIEYWFTHTDQFEVLFALMAIGVGLVCFGWVLDTIFCVLFRKNK